MKSLKELKNFIDPHKTPEKQFYLDLLDGDKQRACEDEHIRAVLLVLKIVRIRSIKQRKKQAEAERAAINSDPDYNAEKYRRVLELNAEISSCNAALEKFRPFFEEPYFGRMDVVDGEGYNSYYIGKHGDETLEIIDWRAPLARKFYQKSRTSFSINQYDYKLILRRALRTFNGKVLDFKNEYLNLSDYLTQEEIGGRDEALVFDPFLKEILSGRKEKNEITDIIETIQEKQYEIITLPESSQFAVQGVAGSGKTMIMLHRLSYIMYNNENIRPTDVMVITPSDSFNSFIDELSAILELERVKTSTLGNYYLLMLKSMGLDVAPNTDFTAPVPEEYGEYIYSERFGSDLDKKLKKIFESVYGIFASEECADAIDSVITSAERQTRLYAGIKNASLRVRRLVLGEIKEKPDGGLYYTKQFRYMFNCVLAVTEFLDRIRTDERMKEYAFFYKQLITFYRAVRYLKRYSFKTCATALTDLDGLAATVEREIADLKRYRTRVGEGEVLTYSAGIEKRENLLAEIEKTKKSVGEIQSGFRFLYDLAGVLGGDEYYRSIGKCENQVDILRFFYREIIRKVKKKMDIPTKPLLSCDVFALCLTAVKLGFNLSPKHAFLFVDEAQDISPAEYAVLRAVNERAVFNIFGDLKQNVTPNRGIRDWAQLEVPVYELNLNYRNTNEIVEYVSQSLGIGMKPIGLGGGEVKRIDKRALSAYFSNKNGLKAVICSKERIAEFSKKSYNPIGKTGKISKTKINLMTVYESKGLEFTAVAVADSDLTPNERYIAYTRALKELAIIND